MGDRGNAQRVTKSGDRGSTPLISSGRKKIQVSEWTLGISGNATLLKSRFGPADQAQCMIWHMFRHTYGTSYARGGKSIYKIAAWMGHSDIRMTKRYAQLADGYDPDCE